jgi:hypothetical protein
VLKQAMVDSQVSRGAYFGLSNLQCVDRAHKTFVEVSIHSACKKAEPIAHKHRYNPELSLSVRIDQLSW